MPHMDFKVSDASEDVTFTLGGDKFSGVPVNRLPGETLIKYTELLEKGSLYQANRYFLAECLTEESSSLFFERLSSKENPIDLATMGKVLNWLVADVYGRFSIQDEEGKE